jgi:hypothetical protein
MATLMCLVGGGTENLVPDGDRLALAWLLHN